MMNESPYVRNEVTPSLVVWRRRLAAGNFAHARSPVAAMTAAGERILRSSVQDGLHRLSSCI
jgi:hypothetical protein